MEREFLTLIAKKYFVCFCNSFYRKIWLLPVEMAEVNEEQFNLIFNINGERITCSFPIDSTDHLFKITNDDEYTINYIFELINNGYISLTEPLKTIKRVEDDGNEVLIYGEEEPILEVDNLEYVQNRTNEWSDTQSVMLLDLYEEYLPLVGPLKKFKTKKNMWNKIAELINKKLNCNKTPIQVENRYKTILKRKKNAVDNNRKSGSERMEVPYENELNKIASIDDSVEPEVLGTASGITILKKSKGMDGYASPSTSGGEESTPKLKRKVKTIQETLWEIHEKKEQAKERRHKEKMDLIKNLFSANNNNTQ